MNKLFEIQKRIGVIKKDKTNPFYNSLYFDINTLLDVVKPLFEEYKVVLLQPLTSIEGKPAISTILIDTENDLELSKTTIPLPHVEDPQKMGSAITYYRRYMLQSLLALEAEDDDGNQAKQTTQPIIHTEEMMHDSEMYPPSGMDLKEDTKLCPTCGNIMTYRSGVKNKKKWGGWFCATKGHPVQWVNL